MPVGEGDATRFAATVEASTSAYLRFAADAMGEALSAVTWYIAAAGGSRSRERSAHLVCSTMMMASDGSSQRGVR
jgi:hypothetical protein